MESLARARGLLAMKWVVASRGGWAMKREMGSRDEGVTALAVGARAAPRLVWGLALRERDRE